MVRSPLRPVTTELGGVYEASAASSFRTVSVVVVRATLVVRSMARCISVIVDEPEDESDAPAIAVQHPLAASSRRSGAHAAAAAEAIGDRALLHSITIFMISRYDRLVFAAAQEDKRPFFLCAKYYNKSPRWRTLGAPRPPRARAQGHLLVCITAVNFHPDL
jgi:hypothetical protein